MHKQDTFKHKKYTSVFKIWNTLDARLPREEACGARKKLERRDHTNPSVFIDSSDDIQATYHEKSDAPRISFARTQY